MILSVNLFDFFLFLHFSKFIFFAINLIVNILIWSITLILFIKIHRKLLDGFQVSLYKKLILSNWSRTFLWTIIMYIHIYI